LASQGGSSTENRGQDESRKSIRQTDNGKGSRATLSAKAPIAKALNEAAARRWSFMSLRVSHDGAHSNAWTGRAQTRGIGDTGEMAKSASLIDVPLLLRVWLASSASHGSVGFRARIEWPFKPSAVSRFRLAIQSGGCHLRVGVVRGQPLCEGAPSQEIADAMPGGKFSGPRSMFAEVVP
jgi:hypothetical protein